MDEMLLTPWQQLEKCLETLEQAVLQRYFVMLYWNLCSEMFKSLQFKACTSIAKNPVEKCRKVRTS